MSIEQIYEQLEIECMKKWGIIGGLYTFSNCASKFYDQDYGRLFVCVDNTDVYGMCLFRYLKVNLTIGLYESEVVYVG